MIGNLYQYPKDWYTSFDNVIEYWLIIFSEVKLMLTNTKFD